MHSPGIAGVGDSTFPRKVEDALIDAVQKNPELALWIRRHPSEAALDAAQLRHPRIRVSSQDMSLHVTLHSCDETIVTVSTVGVEAALAQKPVLQVTGSLLDDLAPSLHLGQFYKRLSLSQIAAEFAQPVTQRRAEQARYYADTWAAQRAVTGDAATQVARVLQSLVEQPTPAAVDGPVGGSTSWH